MTIKSILEKALGLVAAVAQDAAAPSQPSSKGGSQSLAAHDKVYHPNGYKPGDRCKLREGMFSVDDLVAAPTGKATAQGAPIQNGKMLPHSKMPSEKEFDRVIAAVRNNPRLVPPTLAQSLADFPKNIMQMSEDQEYLEQSIAMLPDSAAKDLLQDKADAMDDAHAKAIDQFLKDFTVLQAIFPEGSNINTGKGTAAAPAAPATSKQQKPATAATPPQQSSGLPPVAADPKNDVLGPKVANVYIQTGAPQAFTQAVQAEASSGGILGGRSFSYVLNHVGNGSYNLCKLGGFSNTCHYDAAVKNAPDVQGYDKIKGKDGVLYVPQSNTVSNQSAGSPQSTSATSSQPPASNPAPSQPPTPSQATRPQPQMPPNNLFTKAGFFVGKGRILPSDTFSDLPYLDDPNMRAAISGVTGISIRDTTPPDVFFNSVDIGTNGNVTYEFNNGTPPRDVNNISLALQKAGYQNITTSSNPAFGTLSLTIPMQSFAKLPPMNHGVPAAKSGPAQPTSQTTQAATASTPPAPIPKQQPPPTQATTPSSPAPKAAANTPSTTTSAAKPTAPTATSSSPSPTTPTPMPLKGTPLKGFDKTVSAVVGGGFNKKNVLQDTVACIVAMKVPNSLNIKGQGSMTKNSPLWIEFPSNATAQNVKDIEATLEPIYSPFGYKVKAEDFGNKQYLVIEPTAKSLVKQKASKKPSAASSTASAPQPAQAPTSTTPTPSAASTASSGAPSATTQSSPSASTATKGANLLSSLAAKNPKMAAVYSKAAARMAGTTPTPAAANSPAAPVTSQTAAQPAASTQPAPVNIPSGKTPTPQQAAQIARFQNMIARATSAGLSAQAKSFQAALNRFVSTI